MDRLGMPVRHMENDDDAKRWQLEKHVPLSVIIMLLLQFATTIWWAARVDGRLSVLEREELLHAADSEKLVRIEEKLNYLAERINKMDSR